MQYFNGLRKFILGLFLIRSIAGGQTLSQLICSSAQEFEQVEELNSNPDVVNTESYADDDIVILVLGTDGAGKSLFIDAMANYIEHSDKEYAELTKIGPQVLIPFNYALFDEPYDTYEVMLVDRSADDNEQASMSTPTDACCTKTKIPMDYKIKIPGIDRNLVFIDTPGLSNTGDDLEGPDNVHIIRKFLAERNIKHVNYVTVMISSEEYHAGVLDNTMDAIFKRIVPAINMNNVKFIFTRGMDIDSEWRSNFYAVKKYIDQENAKSGNFSVLKLTDDNVFVIDNICIIDMAVLKYSENNDSNYVDEIYHFKRGSACWNLSSEDMNVMVFDMIVKNRAPYKLPTESE